MNKAQRVSAVVSKRMRAIRGKDTGPELLLRTALYRAGIRYRLHVELPGRPDIAVMSAMVAVFVDGDFWHGHDWRRLRTKLSEEWKDKILANRRRDRRNDRDLVRLGWAVMRFWEHEVKDDPRACANQIVAMYRASSRR